VNGRHQLFVCGDDDDYDNLLGENLNVIKRNTETLLVAGKEVRLEVDTKKTKYSYIFLSREQYAGKRHYMKTANKFFENVTIFKYQIEIVCTKK
jgi:methyl coenzyme M reductase alpha subunit